MRTGSAILAVWALVPVVASAQTSPAPAPAPSPTAVAPPATGAVPRGLPFPAPVATTATDDTKFTSGVVTALDPSGKKFDLATASGPLTCTLEQWSRVVGLDGRVAEPSVLKVGLAIRVYYHTGNGAQVQEIDLVPTR